MPQLFKHSKTVTKDEVDKPIADRLGISLKEYRSDKDRYNRLYEEKMGLRGTRPREVSGLPDRIPGVDYSTQPLADRVAPRSDSDFEEKRRVNRPASVKEVEMPRRERGVTIPASGPDVFGQLSDDVPSSVFVDPQQGSEVRFGKETPDPPREIEYNPRATNRTLADEMGSLRVGEAGPGTVGGLEDNPKTTVVDPEMGPEARVSSGRTLASTIEAPEEVLPDFEDAVGKEASPSTRLNTPEAIAAKEDYILKRAAKDSSPGFMRGVVGGIRRNPVVAGGAALATGAGLYGLSPKEDPEKLEAAKEEPSFQIPMRRPGDPEAPPTSPPVVNSPKEEIGNESATSAVTITGYVPGAKIGRASDQGVNDALKEYKSLADRLESLGLDTSSMDKQMADAAAKYEKRRTTSEWAEVAQTLAQAIARYAAADAGLDWTKLDIPTIDYQKRIERDAKERDSEIERAKLSQRNREQVLGLQRDTLRDRLQVAKEGIGTEENKRRLEQDRITRQAELDLRAQEISGQAGLESRRMADTQFRAAQSIVDDASRDEKIAEGQLQEAQKQIAYYLSGDTKAKDKAEGILSGLGIDTAELDSALSKSGEGWFKFENPGEAKKTVFSSPLLDGIKARLQEARARKARAEAVVDNRVGAPGSKPAAAPAASAAPAKETRVKVKRPDGAVGSIPESQLESALAQGFTRVD